MPREDEAKQQGQQCHEDGGSWRDNPYRMGSREWFAFEDGRRESGAKDVGPGEGTPAWG